MSKYLIVANYTAEGIKGVLAKGGTARRVAVEAAAKNVGGSVESFYFAAGQDDAYVIMDLPDDVTAAAVAMQVCASGLATTRTVTLLSPADIDRAAKITVGYVPPGS